MPTRRRRCIRRKRCSVGWVERSDTHHLTHDRDGFRFALPILHLCELICFASKRNLRAQLRPIGTTGKSAKVCPAPFAKIFRLTCRANHRHNSARLTADEGRWPSSRTRGEMRWTRELRLTCVAQAYGEVVWSRRRGAGAKFARGKPLTGDGGKRAVHRGEHEVSRKAIAQGRPECFRRTCMLVCALPCAHCTRDRGCGAHPVFPAPSVSKRAKSFQQTSGVSRREIANLCLEWRVIATDRIFFDRPTITGEATPWS